MTLSNEEGRSEPSLLVAIPSCVSGVGLDPGWGADALIKMIENCILCNDIVA